MIVFTTSKLYNSFLELSKNENELQKLFIDKFQNFGFICEDIEYFLFKPH